MASSFAVDVIVHSEGGMELGTRGCRSVSYPPEPVRPGNGAVSAEYRPVTGVSVSRTYRNIPMSGAQCQASNERARLARRNQLGDWCSSLPTLTRKIWWTFGDGFQTVPTPWIRSLTRDYLTDQRRVGKRGRPQNGPRIVQESAIRTIGDGFQTLPRWRSGETTTKPAPPLPAGPLDLQDHRSSAG
jgi:hypothetical protein